MTHFTNLEQLLDWLEDEPTIVWKDPDPPPPRDCDGELRYGTYGLVTVYDGEIIYGVVGGACDIWSPL